MKFFNVHLSARSEDAERFDTLIAPSGTVATLNHISKDCGIPAEGFDGAFPDEEKVQHAIKASVEKSLSQGEIPVVMSTLLVYNAEQSLAFIADLKREFKQRVVTVVGGQLVPFATRAYLGNDHIDAVSIGDGEVLIPEVARDVQAGAVKGLYTGWLSSFLNRSRRGQFAFASYDDFFQIQERLEAQKEISGFSQLCIQGLGGPGCSWAANNKHGACDFCALQNIEEMNQRSLPELMQAERDLEDTFSPDRIFDVANQFLPFLNKVKNMQWLKKYIEERKKAGLRAKKYVYLTVGSIDEDIAALLAEAGVEEVFLGIDHFDPDALKEENKSHRSQSRLERTLNALAQNGITFRVGVVLGSATETERTLKTAEEGIHWIIDNEADSLVSLGAYPIYILPGSGVFERVRKMSDLQEVLHSFESKGYFNEEADEYLIRAYIQRHSDVDADAVIETANRLVAYAGAHIISHNYRQSPGAERLKK